MVEVRVRVAGYVRDYVRVRVYGWRVRGLELLGLALRLVLGLELRLLLGLELRLVLGLGLELRLVLGLELELRLVLGYTHCCISFCDT